MVGADGLMSANNVQQATLERIRWLTTCSREAAEGLCADAKVSDPPEVHCARFGLHLVSDVPLPVGYAWEVVTAKSYWTEPGEFSEVAHPLEHHVRVMAIYAANLDDVGADSMRRERLVEPAAAAQLHVRPAVCTCGCNTLMDLAPI